MNLHLNPEWERQLLESEPLKAGVNKAVNALAGHVRDQHIQVGDLTADGVENLIDLPVDVHDDTVVIAHPAGLAVQAKDGALTKAASLLGLKHQG